MESSRTMTILNYINNATIETAGSVWARSSLAPIVFWYRQARGICSPDKFLQLCRSAVITAMEPPSSVTA